MSWIVSWFFTGLLAVGNSGLPIDMAARPSGPGSGHEQFTSSPLEESERFEQTYPFNSNGRVSVSNINGSIILEAWDRNEIRLEAIKKADDKERFAEVQIKIDHSRDSFSVETDYDSWWRSNSEAGKWRQKNYGKLSVEFKLMVPRGASLNEIETINGSVLVSNFTNFTKVSAVNGQVRARNLRGNAELSTVNGTTEADFESLQETGEISLETVNGKVMLSIPSDSNATLKADTVNGSISNDFGLPVRKGQYVGRDLYGKLGSGGVKIKLSSVNGGLSILRKDDGKQISPATNLLTITDKEARWENGAGATASGSGPARAPRSGSSGRGGSPSAVAPVPPVAPVAPVPGAVAPVGLNSEELALISDEALQEAAAGFQEAAQALAEAKIGLSEARRSELSAEELKELETELKEAEAAMKQAQAEMHEQQKNFEQRKRKLIASAQENVRLLQENIFPLGENGYSSLGVDKTTDSFPVKGVPKVALDVRQASVSIRGWDKQEISYTIAKLSRNSGAKSQDFEVKRGESELSIKSTGEPERGYPVGKKSVYSDGTIKNSIEFVRDGSSRIKIELFVPRKTNLKIVTDMAIRLEGVSGELDIKGGRGAVNVIDSSGSLRLATASGNSRVIGFIGDLDAETAEGNISLEGEFRSINARTTSGSYTLSIANSSNAFIQSSSASVRAEGLALTKEGANRWKIGKGGANFNFALEDGSLLIRSAEAISQ